MALLKLLVVEDHIPSLELMAEVFISLEAEVLPLSDSQEAAKLIDKEKFDGIFLDLEMPDMSGFDLARRIRKSSWNKTTPIVIVTGREEQETMREAFAIGATFFLQKPVDRRKLSVLFRTVRGGMLDNRRRSVRVPIQTEVTCEVGSRAVRGVTWNLSQGGIQVEVGDGAVPFFFLGQNPPQWNLGKACQRAKIEYNLLKHLPRCHRTLSQNRRYASWIAQTQMIPYQFNS